jgi:hypothetical protein
MRTSRLNAMVLGSAIAFGAASAASAVTITAFNFENLSTGINNSPAPTIGSGTATPLGMTNSFTSPPSVTNCDVLSNPGSTTPSLAWRIRGGGTGSGNGWAAAAPQYSQGSQYLVDTTGYQDIVLTYDWFCTTQGVKHQQVQYTTDGSVWNNVGPLVVGPATEGWTNGITVDMSSIAGVNDNPFFGVRIVSAYAPDGPNAGQYVNLAGNPINSTSGNWRMDSINISGNLIPEPGSLSLLALGGLGLVARRRD